ncbi:hypothetical protein SLS62_004794 [Diatrype stigma]|uniref:Uncharacterized protein n=1 Tax=Diatrype stigma TaxID=117547 RepID=A0AAN9YTF1_9PEZI
MRGLSKAAVIFAAPALAAARPFTTAITQVIEDVFIQETFLRFDVLESDAACGYGNITLDGQELYQDETGFGSGSLVTEHGNLIVADWKFTCSELGNEHQEQQIKFDVIYIDENKVRDVGFSLQFRQVAPVAITSIDGAEYLIEGPDAESGRGDARGPSTSPGVDDELALLEMMRLQLAQLENAIAKKEKYIAETFGLRDHLEGGGSHLMHCDSVRCVVKTVLKNVKGMAHGLSPGDHHHHPKRPTSPPFGHEALDTSPHEHSPQDPMGTHRGGFQVQSHQTTSSPHEIPTQEFHPIKSHERPFHVNEEEINDVPLTQAPQGHHPHMHNIDDTKLAIRLFTVLTVLGLIISAVHTRCCAKARAAQCDGRRGRSHNEKRAARRARCLALRQKFRETAQAWGWQWRRPGTPGVEDEEKDIAAAPASGDYYPAEETRRYSRSSRDRDDGDADDDAEDSDVDSDALSTTMEQELAQFRAVAGVVGDMIAAEEGRRLRAAVAVAVDTHHQHGHYGGGVYGHAHAHASPSPTSTLPEYAAMDEPLPPYDEGSNDPLFVADGFQYTPGSSAYTPDSSGSSQASSLDDNKF